MKIKSIKEVSPRMVYAIETSTGTFIADGLAHHNCVGCNMFGRGKLPVFAERLADELGKKKFKALMERSRSGNHPDMLKLTDHYQKKLNKIIKEKGLAI